MFATSLSLNGLANFDETLNETSSRNIKGTQQFGWKVLE